MPTTLPNPVIVGGFRSILPWSEKNPSYGPARDAFMRVLQVKTPLAPKGMSYSFYSLRLYENTTKFNATPSPEILEPLEI